MVETKKNKNYTLTYGDDHIEGLFYKVVSVDGTVVAEDSKMHNPKLTLKHLVGSVWEYGFDLSDEVDEDVVEYD